MPSDETGMHSWESGRGREHVGDVEPAASQLAELVRSPTDTMSPTPHALPVAFQRSYGGATDQAAAVRADLAQVAEDFPVADGLVLLASELSTNAMMHSRSGLPGQTFTVRAELRPGRYAWLEVEDQGGEWVSRESDDEHWRAAIARHLTLPAPTLEPVGGEIVPRGGVRT